MQKFGLSQSTPRSEDPRLLTGHGAYVDDIAPAGALHAYMLRSPMAHGTVAELDLEAARDMPGVHMILTSESIQADGLDDHIPTDVADDGTGRPGVAPRRPLLARGRVRFVGEGVAMVVAETRDQARDAAEAIRLDVEELPAKVDVAPGGQPVHDEAPDNVAYVWEAGDAAAVDAAFASAHRTVRLEVEDNRIICASLEPRGCYAEPVDGGRLHVCVNGQGVWGTKRRLAKILGMDVADVRVTNPDVGGGFGMKANDYPETFLVAHAARTLGRPVRWMSDRSEAMLSDNAGRDLRQTAELAFDEELRITAYRSTNVANMGAYNSAYAQNIQSELLAKVLTGVYDIPAAHLRSTGVFTNTTQVDAYRGAGRPEAIFVLERAMDRAAHELGVDRFELRRRSFVKPHQFPYETPTGESYDVGDFDRVLDRALAEADVAGLQARRAEAAARGRLLGLGACYYIESILGNPAEHAELEFTEGGGARLYVGTQSNGQGHETVYRQFLATDLGLPPEAVEIVQGDSDRIATGGGTGGSRSVTTQGTANKAVAEEVIARFAPFVSEHLGCEAAFEDGQWRATGSNTVMTMLEAAQAARAAGREDLMRTRKKARIDGRSYPNGCHLCEVEIDPETGGLEVTRYTVVDDFGTLMNPMMAEGQVHGGVAQGIGQAVSEHVVYDEDGQLLTASFMDYGMPRAVGLPMIAFHSEPVPSTRNPMGMKGCGEAGTVGAMAAIGNAVEDALRGRGVGQVDMPFTPARLWSALQGAAPAVAAE
jgi:carbon-monoxide dehydrogenase large subunit